MKKINFFVLFNLACALVFSMLNVCFNADVSCLSFVVSIAFTAAMFFVIYVNVIKNDKLNFVFASKKLLQYEPYVFLLAFIIRRSGEKGTSYAYDLICVIIWLCIFVSGIILQKFFEPKQFKQLTDKVIKEVKNENLVKMLAKGKNSSGQKVMTSDYAKWFVFEIIDWIDALVQAVFMVLLFQIFFFQFYKIPSESMVPEYMVNDRVAVSKITSGPKFPLSDVGLPNLKHYNRGDIVVFRNPHYVIDRKSEVKTVLSQITYMLTFTLVNTNTDEYGMVKADPLVKRICGVSGEQLMMQDGILYTRTKDSTKFNPVEVDKTWAVYNLNEENEALKKYIVDLSITDEIYDGFIYIEDQRNNLNLSECEEECRLLAKKFEAAVPAKASRAYSDDYLLSVFTDNDIHTQKLFYFYPDFAQRLISMDEGTAWFNAYMTDWIAGYKNFEKDGYIGGNLYDDCAFKFNIMYKLALGRLVVYIAENMKKQIPSETWMTSEELHKLHEELHLLFNYAEIHDQRNMPVFPANDESGNPQYIPNGCYFMMGDNRFHSLDMRHTEKRYVAKITRYDNFSVNYYSTINQMYVPQKLILGSTGIRFWPISRPLRNSKSGKIK